MSQDQVSPAEQVIFFTKEAWQCKNVCIAVLSPCARLGRPRNRTSSFRGCALRGALNSSGNLHLLLP
eukprot:3627374-Amphidinium_carterae.1